MKPEDVPNELVRVALAAYDAAYADGLRPRDCTRAALAAVIPLIEAREMEACAAVAEAFPARTHGSLATAPYAAAEQAADEIATAIRALPLTGDET